VRRCARGAHKEVLVMKDSQGGACEEMFARPGKDTCRSPHIADLGYLLWPRSFLLRYSFLPNA
jgi:hypothetical protein